MSEYTTCAGALKTDNRRQRRGNRRDKRCDELQGVAVQRGRGNTHRHATELPYSKLKKSLRSLVNVRSPTRTLKDVYNFVTLEGSGNMESGTSLSRTEKLHADACMHTNTPTGRRS